jgi:hypothetical protein
VSDPVPTRCPLLVLRVTWDDDLDDYRRTIERCAQPVRWSVDTGSDLYEDGDYELDPWWKVECLVGHVLFLADTEGNDMSHRYMPTSSEVRDLIAALDQSVPATITLLRAIVSGEGTDPIEAAPTPGANIDVIEMLLDQCLFSGVHDRWGTDCPGCIWHDAAVVVQRQAAERERLITAIRQRDDLLNDVLAWLGAPDWTGPQLPTDVARRWAVLEGVNDDN